MTSCSIRCNQESHNEVQSTVTVYRLAWAPEGLPSTAAGAVCNWITCPSLLLLAASTPPLPGATFVWTRLALTMASAQWHRLVGFIDGQGHDMPLERARVSSSPTWSLWTADASHCTKDPGLSCSRRHGAVLLAFIKVCSSRNNHAACGPHVNFFNRWNPP